MTVTVTTIDEMWDRIVEKNPNIDDVNWRWRSNSISRLNLTGLAFRGINLSGNFSGFDISESNLSGSSFFCCDLQDANLSRANLLKARFIACDLADVTFDRANLYGCYFAGCRFNGATFEGAEMNWASHELIGYRLFEAAKSNPDKRKIAGLIFLSKNWCWSDFMHIPSRHKDWVYRTMKSWLVEGEAEPYHLLKLRFYLEQKKDRG